MKEMTYSAWCYSSGHIIIGSDSFQPPAGTIRLMSGPVDKLIMILDGNLDVRQDEKGVTFWVYQPLEEQPNSAKGYMTLMLWLAKVRQRYADLKHITFFVNEACNKDVRRKTAKAINNVIN